MIWYDILGTILELLAEPLLVKKQEVSRLLGNATHQRLRWSGYIASIS